MDTLITILIIIGAIVFFSYLTRKDNKNYSSKRVRSEGDDFMNEVERETKELREWNRQWSLVNSPVVKFNNKGIEYEKSGMIDKAILEYEKCMVHMYKHIGGPFMKSFARHSPNRLRILYKKQKHPKEKEFLREYISKCKEYSIECPDIFKRQLDKIKSHN
ncbi:hypothetical protein GM418_10805 [Maribellus comscasis]|uniref:Uncharacterized protein n=1 Tax=Maribellus comscasis TaxID=2681766 RepID=A0A6I6JSC3_9BACT|nr:hypothetical protein [Maribellus comscasis]QGY44129.1 hypothetical protein GM418_10805 [Maribellus comscasis]